MTLNYGALELETRCHPVHGPFLDGTPRVLCELRYESMRHRLDIDVGANRVPGFVNVDRDG
jgi:hypothetical protein